MRRSVEPRLQARGPQNRCQRCRGRAFAVCPRDQDAGKTPLGVFQSVQQDAHVRQIELVRRRLSQFVAQGVHSRNGSFVGGHAVVSLQSSVFS